MFKTLLVILLFPLWVVSQTKKNNYSYNNLIINGSVNNFENVPKYIFGYFLDGNKTGLDSFKVINGKYKIQRRIKSSVMVTLHSIHVDDPEAYKSKNMLVFISEATTVTVKSSENLFNARVIGSKANLEYIYLDSLIETHAKHLPKLYNMISSTERKNEIKFSIDSIGELITQTHFKYFIRYPKSLIKSFVLGRYASRLPSFLEQQKVTELINAYNTLTNSEKESFDGKKILKKINSYTVKVGNHAPMFSQEDTLGRLIHLNDFKGKYVLLDFWASWCAPCRREIPYFKKVYEKVNLKKVEIIGISLDKERSSWVEAIVADNISWINVSDLKFWNNNVARLYKISAVPANFLLDPNGKIVAKNIKPSELDDFLNTPNNTIK